MKKYNEKRAKKLWELSKREIKARAALDFIPLTEDDNKTPAIKYAGSNSLYMKKCRRCLNLKDDIAKLMFGCPDVRAVGIMLGYDEKYKKKKKNK